MSYVRLPSDSPKSHHACQNCNKLLSLSISYYSTDEGATIRVTNLSEDTRETDLQELFKPFGAISRIYLAMDKNTGQSKVCRSY